MNFASVEPYALFTWLTLHCCTRGPPARSKQDGAINLILAVIALALAVGYATSRVIEIRRASKDLIQSVPLYDMVIIATQNVVRTLGIVIIRLTSVLGTTRTWHLFQYLRENISNATSKETLLLEATLRKYIGFTVLGVCAQFLNSVATAFIYVGAYEDEIYRNSNYDEYAFIVILPDLLLCLSYLHAILFIMLFGTAFLRSYSILAYELISYWNQLKKDSEILSISNKAKGMKKTPNATSPQTLENFLFHSEQWAWQVKDVHLLDEFAIKLLELKFYLQQFKTLAGAFAACLTVSAGVDVIARVATIATKGMVYENVIGLICGNLHNLLLIGYFGTLLNTTMQECRDSLKSAMVGADLDDDEHSIRLPFKDYEGDFKSQLKRLSKWFLDWEWNFSALQLFNVDRSLFLKVIEVIMTYFMVIFQLHLSEKENWK